MTWKTIARPGYFGKTRDEKLKMYDEEFGLGNWRIAWMWNEASIDYHVACTLYEDAYYADSFQRQAIWMELTHQAKDVFDIHESDIQSTLDYTIQTGTATHLQDIAIRRVVLRRGWTFSGREYVQIRGHKTYWGLQLSPGKIPFQVSRNIQKPNLQGWWDENSVEDFYQSNKVLQVRDWDDFHHAAYELTGYRRQQTDAEKRANALESALEKQINQLCKKMIPAINKKLKGKAPQIISYRVRFPFIGIELDCYDEDLMEEGRIIQEIAQAELDSHGLNMMKVSIPAKYYAK
ncbi:hypothetical protein C4573_04640 [Candidatus Woesearchaeota archaeon]|nr:MAG: hypothetical protein C4573_04640 [Candidatus Woesearchaeota archaeon]